MQIWEALGNRRPPLIKFSENVLLEALFDIATTSTPLKEILSGALRRIREAISGDYDGCQHWFRAGQFKFNAAILAAGSNLFIYLGPTEQLGPANPVTVSRLLLHTAPDGSPQREEQEESDEEDDNRDGSAEGSLTSPSHPIPRTDSPRSLPEPFITHPIPLPASAFANDSTAIPPANSSLPLNEAPEAVSSGQVNSTEREGGGQSEGEKLSVAGQGGSEIMSTEKRQGLQGHGGNEDPSTASVREVIGANQHGEDRTMDVGRDNSGGPCGAACFDANQNGRSAISGCDQDVEEHHSEDPGRADEKESVDQNMDVDQTSFGEVGSANVVVGSSNTMEKERGIRRSDRKRKTPPPPEREGMNRGKPKPTDKKKAKSKKPSSPKPKPKPKPEPELKSNPHPNSVERSYFEEIEFGGISRLVDMIDLTQDMVSDLSIYRDRAY
jgi:hypothetical protein